MENDDVEFSSDDKVLEFKVRANTVDQIKIPANQVLVYSLLLVANCL